MYKKKEERQKWNPISKELHYCSQDRRNIAIVPIESCIERIRLSNLGNRVLITRDLEYDCFFSN